MSGHDSEHHHHHNENADEFAHVKRDPATIAQVGNSLSDKSQDIAQRFRDIFTLRCQGGPLAAAELIRAFDNDDSALLKHEIAYTLGQMQLTSVIPFLSKVLANESEDTMVRHEAGEALGAIGSDEALAPLEKYSKDPSPEVAETCQIALDRIKWAQKGESVPSSAFTSIDPAPPLASDEDLAKLTQDDRIKKLGEQLMDKSLSLFDRYRAMFSLRDIGNEAAVYALAEGFNDDSALFRHEIAFVFGQLQHPASATALSKVLGKEGEHCMVRHEAAEALGSIADQDTLPVLQSFAGDDNRVVRESCHVALDIHNYVTSDEFEYANSVSKVSQ